MNFGLSDSDFQILKSLVIEPLKKRAVRVFVFGSRATGKNHKFSDLDLLLVPSAGSSLSPNELSQIKESIEESRFTIKVDFVLLQDLAKTYCEQVLLERKEL